MVADVAEWHSNGSLKDASSDRLTCLLRHWAWADEAMRRFEQELVPASVEERPRVVNLLRDEETLGRLRRVHNAFGEALHEERLSREIDSLNH